MSTDPRPAGKSTSHQPALPASGLRPASPAAAAAQAAATRIGPKATVELWKCNQCSRSLEKGCVASGAADIIDGKLLCKTCLNQRQHAAARAKRRAVMAIGGVVLAVAAGTGYVISNRSAQQAEQRLQAEQITSGGDAVSEYLLKDQCLPALRQIKSMEDRAAKMDEASARQFDAAIASAKERVDAWFQRTYGNLEANERKILVSLLGTYSSDGDNPVQILSLHLDHGKLMLKVVGSQPVAEKAEASGSPIADVGITHDLRPRRAMEEARQFLIYVFNTFPEVSLVEMEWFVSTPNDPEAFGSFSANRRQLTRLEEPNLDLARLSDKSVEVPAMQP